MEDVQELRAQAWLVVVLFLVVAVVIVITLAYSTVNTPYTVDGDKAVYSQYLDSGK